MRSQQGKDLLSAIGAASPSSVFSKALGVFAVVLLQDSVQTATLGQASYFTRLQVTIQYRF